MIIWKSYRRTTPRMVCINLRATLLLLFIPAFFAHESAASAASFDCARAQSKIERQICADPKLSALDDELAQVYKDALGRVSDPEALKKAQRDWLKKVRSSLETPYAIATAYRARIDEIALDAPGLSEAVTRYAEKRGA